MMMIRAIFWIGVMALVVPRDPGLILAGSHVSGAPQGAACTADLETCLHGQDSVASIRELAFARLAEVKRDLAAKR